MDRISRDRSADRTVGVFRLQLFKPSETFIHAQVAKYRRYRPVYLGLACHGNPPSGVELAVPHARTTSAVRLFGWGDVGPFIKALEGRKLDVIHAHFGVDAAFALPLAERLGIPLVTTLHGFDVTVRDWALLARPRPALLSARLRRSALQRRGDRFLCVSEFIRGCALARGYPQARLAVAPLGIDLSRFRLSEQIDRNLIVHVGRLVEKKGSIFLIRAFAKVLVEIPTARLAIIGDGPLLPTLRAEVGSLGLSSQITFFGALPHSETIERMSEAAVVAVPSVTASDGDSEGLPTVIFEAAALARPVVASRTSGIPEAVQDGVTGVLVEERDVVGLSAALVSLLSDPPRARALGGAARLKMEAEFDADNLTDRLESIYDEVLAKGGAGH